MTEPHTWQHNAAREFAGKHAENKKVMPHPKEPLPFPYVFHPNHKGFQVGFGNKENKPVAVIHDVKLNGKWTITKTGEPVFNREGKDKKIRITQERKRLFERVLEILQKHAPE